MLQQSCVISATSFINKNGHFAVILHNLLRDWMKI